MKSQNGKGDGNLSWRQAVVLAWPALAVLGILTIGAVAEKDSIAHRLFVGPSGVFLWLWIVGVIGFGAYAANRWLKPDSGNRRGRRRC